MNTAPVIFTQTVAWELGTLAAGAVLAALILAIGHWFPWARTLSRIASYVYGVVSIIAGFALWRLLNHDYRTVLGLLAIACAGGLTVVLAYQIDVWVLEIRRGHKAAAADPELQSQPEA
jgi:hypothetical protein